MTTQTQHAGPDEREELNDGQMAILIGFLKGIAAIIRSGEPERLSVKDYEPIEKAVALLADSKAGGEMVDLDGVASFCRVAFGDGAAHYNDGVDAMLSELKRKGPLYTHPQQQAAQAAVPQGLVLVQGYERLIDQYIEEYEFTDGDSGYHDPSEFEQAMIKDAFMGFDFSSLFCAVPAPVEQKGEA